MSVPVVVSGVVTTTSWAVPGSNQFYAYVTKLVSNGITAGMGGGNYGVGQPTLRQQMAVFLSITFGLQ